MDTHLLVRYLRRSFLALLTASLLFPQGSVTAQTPEWRLVRTGAPGEEFVAVAVHPAKPEHVFAATARVVYGSLDGGGTWKELFRVPAQVTVTHVAVSAGEPPALLLATDQGLYGSFDGGRRWRRVFRGVREGSRHGTYVAFHLHQADTALLGTRDGLYVSTTHGRRWKAVALPQTAREVVHFAFDPQGLDRLYVVTAQGLFLGSLDSGRWVKRLTTFHAEDLEVEGSDQEETGEAPDTLHRLSAIAVDPLMPSTFYLATSGGLLRSPDEGLSWHWLARSGLTSPALSLLLLQRHSPLVLYAATDRGVARYEPETERWEMVTNGLAAALVNDLAATDTELWAATAQGLYHTPVPTELFSDPEPPSAQELLANFTHEPTIREVQEAAIRYAEVHPDKIRRWRTQANLKALLPTVRFDFDKEDDLFIDAQGSTSDPKTDRFLTMRDPSKSFDISVNWDLGELIWNDDQTSIDVRSKLMVQLRDDIVDEVTRTYFERRRLQVKFLTTPSAAPQALMDDELRLRELAALIDGLTGGWFSEQLEWKDH